MATIRLVGNLAFSGLPAGHLQLVKYNNGVHTELEVSSGQYWKYGDAKEGGHSASPNFVDISDDNYSSFGYSFVTLNLGGRSADDVWQILTAVNRNFIEKAQIEYKLLWKNSNSYANTLLYTIGISLHQYIDNARPLFATSFPGANLNVLLTSQDAISLNLSGTVGPDIIYGGIKDDIFYDLGAGDLVYGGGGFDTAALPLSLGSYSIQRTGEKITLGTAQGLLTINSIEYISFPDMQAPLMVSSLPDGVFIASGSQIDYRITSSIGNIYITNEISQSTISVTPSAIGWRYDPNQGSVAEFLRIRSQGVTPASPGLPEALQLDTGTSRIAIDTRFKQIAIEGVGSVSMQELLAPTLSDDHGDTHSNATPIGTGTITGFVSATGNIERRGDVDWFSVSLQGGVRYGIALSASSTPNNQLDPMLGLRLPNNTVLMNDDIGATVSMSYLSYDVPTSGVYQIQALGVGTTTGSYFLSIVPLSFDATATTLMPTTGQTDGSGPPSWDWEGTSDDNFPSELILEAGGRPQTTGNNRYRGHDGDDTIKANAGDDIVWGDDDEDKLYGESGNDTLRGGKGDDRIWGGPDNDLIYGEDGDDKIQGDTSSTTDSGNDTIYGGDGIDEINGGKGNDYIKGEDDNDNLDGDAGNDEVYGDKGNDEVDGDIGDDQLFGGRGNDILDGGEGRDRLAGEADNDFLTGRSGDDALYGGDGDDILRGGSGNDLLHGESGIDTADFLDGNDGVLINLFDEIAISSDLGTDTLYSIENIIGSDGRDVIDGNHSPNHLRGSDDNDIIRGHNGNDTIYGDDDNDVVWGDDGEDFVSGDSGNDEVRGGLGNDSLFGGADNDHLRGEQGDDTVDGGDGTDSVFFWGERDDFEISLNPDNSYRVQDTRPDGLEGKDTVRNVEVFQFFDGDVPVGGILSAPPVAVGDVAAVASDDVIAIDVVDNDSDPGGDVVSIFAVTKGSALGNVSIVNGIVVYDPRDAFASLASGVKATDTFSYIATDGNGRMATASVTVDVVGAIKNTGALSIAKANARGAEGQGGSTPFTFTVTRSGDASGPATATWSVIGGTLSGTIAANGADFLGGAFPSDQISFAPDERTRTITIDVAGDTSVELNESFSVVLSDPAVGVTLGVSSAVGVILNDDTLLSIAATSASKPEGSDVAGTPFTFTVTRGGNTSQVQKVDWSVTGLNGTGTVPANAADFVGGTLPSGEVQFLAGQTTALVTVNVVADRSVEANERFAVTLSSPTGGATITKATASGLIQNDDARGTGTLSIARLSASKPEGNAGSTAFSFTVTRSGTTTGPAVADWKASGGGVAGTTAATAADFAGGAFPTGVVTFLAGESSKTITLDVAGDTTAELNESFTVTLSNVPSGVSLGTAAATAVIFDDDTITNTAANETLNGTAGADVFMLGGGLDVVLGKGGLDAFRFLQAAIGPAGSNATTLEDFNRAAGERLDLSRIDAIAGTAANDAFSFIGTAAFNGTPGQLRWQDQGGGTLLIQGNVNANTVADLTILVKATGPVDAGWFVL